MPPPTQPSDEQIEREFWENCGWLYYNFMWQTPDGSGHQQDPPPLTRDAVADAVGKLPEIEQHKFDHAYHDLWIESERTFQHQLTPLDWASCYNQVVKQQ